MAEQANGDSFWIVTADEAGGRVERGFGEAVARTTLRAVGLDTLKGNMHRFLDQLREILDAGADRIGRFELEQVEVTAQIGGNGQIALVGSGVKVEAQGGIRLILRRSQP